MTFWNRTRGALAATAMAFVLGGLAANPALARTNYAVLVAVTAYPNLPKKASLIGPNHDAVLVRDYLTTNAPAPFDPQNVIVLADGLDGAAASPTRERIVATLKDVAAKVQRDDFVYLHLSGHGAQQPETVTGSESDGFDEIFLPADTSKWVDQTKGVPNALVDDDIGGALDAIRDKGAFVWVIFDACHSGTATRAAPVSEDLEVSRKLDFDDLGIPQAAVEAAASGAAEEDADRQPAFTLGETGEDGDAARAVTLGEAQPTGAEAITKGGMVAFFAAQTIETTPEMPLPKGQKDAEKYGLFTYTIFSKLAENPNMTYRQLGHAVLQQYSADSRERPTPLFEGELDARVFGTEKLDTVMQWPLTIKDNAATLPAGRLHRLFPGTRLALLPSPASELKDTIGYVEVGSAKNLSSSVFVDASDGKPALKLADLPKNVYARLAEVTLDFSLRVARPAPSEGLDVETRLVDAVLDGLVDDPEKRFKIILVEPGAEADIRLAVLRENAIDGAAADATEAPALWFLPSSGEVSLKNGKRPPLVAIDPADVAKFAKSIDVNLDRPASGQGSVQVAIDPADSAKLATGVSDNLTKIFRATSLSRLAAASDYQPDQVSVAFKIKREGSEALEPLDGASVPIVNPGDEVHIEAQNLSTRLVDINILYVGSDYSITHIDAQRLVSGAKVSEGLLAFTDTSFGMERMIAVLTEAPPQSEIEDLKFLEQGGVPPATRAVGEAGGFSNLLADIGMAPSTRSAMKLGDKGGQKGAVMIFSLETKPRT